MELVAWIDFWSGVSLYEVGRIILVPQAIVKLPNHTLQGYEGVRGV